MKTMKMMMTLIAVVGLVLAMVPAAMAVTIETVTVGNTGNGSLVNAMWNGGAISYEYRIGKYEVSNAQWAEFLTAVQPDGNNYYGLAPAAFTFSGGTWSVAVGSENQPVRYISLANAYRFANWMSNGQPSGQLTGTWANDVGLTEQGPYAIEGRSNPVISFNPGVQVDCPDTVGERAALAAGATATWVVPTWDEWLKAAWHKNNGDTSDYWKYPTASDTTPTDVLSGTGANEGVWDGDNVTPTGPANVNNCGGLSAYGAMGMLGNVREMCQYDASYWTQGYDHDVQGGSYKSTIPWDSDSTYPPGRGYERLNPSSSGVEDAGLRLVALFTPPPAGTMFIVK